MSVLYPSQSKVIFKWRSKTLDIKSHLTYKYEDLLCRGCGVEEENLSHILNCGVEATIDSEFDVLSLDEIDEVTMYDLKRMVHRINMFLEKVSSETGETTIVENN